MKEVCDWVVDVIKGLQSESKDTPNAFDIVRAIQKESVATERERCEIIIRSLLNSCGPQATLQTVEKFEKAITLIRESQELFNAEPLKQKLRVIDEEFFKDVHQKAQSKVIDLTQVGLAREIYLLIIANQKVLIEDAPNTVELAYTLAKAFIERKPA